MKDGAITWHSATQTYDHARRVITSRHMKGTISKLEVHGLGEEVIRVQGAAMIDRHVEPAGSDPVDTIDFVANTLWGVGVAACICEQRITLKADGNEWEGRIIEAREDRATALCHPKTK